MPITTAASRSPAVALLPGTGSEKSGHSTATAEDAKNEEAIKKSSGGTRMRRDVSGTGADRLRAPRIGGRRDWKMATELCPFAIQVLDLPHATRNAMVCGKKLLGEDDAGLPAWQHRIQQLVDAPSPDPAILEPMECLPSTTDDWQLGALDDLVRDYRSNEKRMRYTLFREWGLPIGSGPPALFLLWSEARDPAPQRPLYLDVTRTLTTVFVLRPGGRFERLN